LAQPAPDGPRPPIAAAVIVNDGRVLLVRRRIKEGSLSWQFPAGEMEEGESPGATAVRETREEIGLCVAETKLLGKRVHPVTGRTMIYVACDVVSGDARVVDEDELAELAWSDRATLYEYVPYGLHESVQEYLDAVLEDRT
jgi:8-oxo-dGTP diphosphatase